VLAGLMRLNRQAGTVIETRLLLALPEDQQRIWRAEIKHLVDAFVDEMNSRSHTLYDDLLFPAMKDTMLETKQDEIIRRWEEESYPKLTQPDRMMIRTEEAYRKNLHEFFRSRMSSQMFLVAYEELQEDLALLGRSFSAQTTSGVWPLQLEILR